jgi:hypothetical protein
MRRVRYVEVESRRAALTYYRVTVANLQTAILCLGHQKIGIQRRRGFQAH